jgi:hypothetical protein
MRVNETHVWREKRFIERALAEVMVANDWWRIEHRVQSLYEPQELPWFVISDYGKSYFQRHKSFSAGVYIWLDQLRSNISRIASGDSFASSGMLFNSSCKRHCVLGPPLVGTGLALERNRGESK